MSLVKKMITIISVKNRVSRSVKEFLLHYFFGQKCEFYACFTLIGSWEGGKNLRVGICLDKNLVRVGLQEKNYFFRPNLHCLYQQWQHFHCSPLLSTHFGSTFCFGA